MRSAEGELQNRYQGPRPIRRKGEATATKDNSTATALADSDDELQHRLQSATEACDFLKALANEQRLHILCLLAEGEKSVTELEALLQLRQSAVSQQLARLREQAMVTYRRDGKTLIYSLSGEAVTSTLTLLHELFCSRKEGA